MVAPATSAAISCPVRSPDCASAMAATALRQVTVMTSLSIGSPKKCAGVSSPYRNEQFELLSDECGRKTVRPRIAGAGAAQHGRAPPRRFLLSPATIHAVSAPAILRGHWRDGPSIGC